MAKAKTKPAGRKPGKAKAKPPRAAKVAPIPPGHATVTAHLIVDGAAEAMDFYKKAFGAKILGKMPFGDGKRLMHGAMRIGDSMVYLVDTIEEFGMKGPKALGGSVVTLHLFVPNVDKAFARAVEAGCTPTMAPADMFWGDRYGKVRDPFGHDWSLATHIKDMTPKEMAAAGKAAMAEMTPK